VSEISQAGDVDRLVVLDLAERARVASRELALANRATKDEALREMASALIKRTSVIVQANTLDLTAAKASQMNDALIDRLTLDASRIQALATALVDVAALKDPVGEVIRGWRVPNSLQITQVRVPLGVVGVIYEARPNVTVDAAALCLKSGNAVLLRGSSSARNTNEALVEAMQIGLASAGLSADLVSLVPGETHESVKHLMTARGLVDVLVPRGGAALIQGVIDEATVPVLETGVGNCHIYVDRDVDIDMAVKLVVNSKAQRVSVCNAAETLLVNADVADVFMPKVLEALAKANVTVHGCPQTQVYAGRAGINFEPVTDQDWAAEYYSLDLAVGLVDSLGAAIEHIQRWSTGHTEAIYSDSIEAINEFVARVDAAAVMVNASTRFTDGGEFGFGAEVGISTQKLHARGPMGLTELTTTKYIVQGEGQVRV
jgi:glutamate-5-semialdehyde dehydrogenase